MEIYIEFMHLAKRKLRTAHLSGKGMQGHIVSFLNKCDSVGNEIKWNTMDTPNVLCMLISKLLLPVADSRWKKNTSKKQATRVMPERLHIIL